MRLNKGDPRRFKAVCSSCLKKNYRGVNCSDCVKEVKKLYQRRKKLQNPKLFLKKSREASRSWRLANLEKCREQTKLRMRFLRSLDPEKFQKYRFNYVVKNRKKIAERQRNYVERNREKVNANQRVYWSRQKYGQFFEVAIAVNELERKLKHEKKAHV